MANCKKYNRAACGHMFKHYERAKDENGEYLKFGNQDIDTSRTHLNYNLAAADQPGWQGDFVKKRCSEVKIQNRADINVMCSWIVTAPKEIQPEETEKFFQEAYKFLSERYGTENVISAHVHMDETTPHIHFAFVPVVRDKKKDILKVSAKEAIDKWELQRFHKDLSNHMESVFGRDIGILNEATKEGNRSTEELKRGTAIEELEAIEREKEKFTQEIQKAKSEIKKIKDDMKQEQKNFTTMQKKFKPRQDDLERVNKLAKQVKPPVLSKNVSLSEKDWKFIVNIAQQHAKISDATLAALENQSEIIEKLEHCQRLYLAIATELGVITHLGDRQRLKHAAQEVLKDVEDWRVVAWTYDDMVAGKPSSLDKLIKAREKAISKKYSYAKETKEYNQPSVLPTKTKRRNSEERD
jgi:hypothetical protein